MVLNMEIVALSSGLIGLIIYFFKFSKQIAKLDTIDILNDKIDVMNKNLTKDLVSISLLEQRVDHLEEEIKEIKNLINRSHV